MSNAADMSTPVTRGELQEELAKLATKAELEVWGGALLARIQATEQGLTGLRDEMRQLVKGTEQSLRDEMRQLVKGTEQSLRDEMRQLVKGTEQSLQELIKATQKQLQTDLASHAGALFESMSALITAHDDKYKDLPARVSRIEAKVLKRKAH